MVVVAVEVLAQEKPTGLMFFLSFSSKKASNFGVNRPEELCHG